MKSIFFSFIGLCFFLTGCSKDAEEAADSTAGFSAADINGSWREGTSGSIVYISGVSAGTGGTGKLTNCGTAFPPAALNGICMKQVEHQSGGYWEAYSQRFINPSGPWYEASIIGLAMNDAKTQFKIGSAVYVRQ